MVIVKEKDEFGHEKIVFRKSSATTFTPIRQTKAQEKLNQPLEQRLESAKRTVCWILRHGALKLGMNITSDGFVYLDDLTVREEFKKLGVSSDQVRDIVLNETKYYDVFTDNDCKVNVRAKWGHSMEGISTKYPTNDKIETNETTEIDQTPL